MTQTITKRVNIYRTMKAYFIGFDIPVDNLVVESYTKENGQSRMKGLSVFSFDTISYIRTSQKGFIHCVGVIGTELYQLVLKPSNMNTNRLN